MQLVVWELLNLHFNRFSKTFLRESQTFLFVFLLNFNMKRNLFFCIAVVVFYHKKKYAHIVPFVPILYQWPMVPRMITGISEGFACIFYTNKFVLPNSFEHNLHTLFQCFSEDYHHRGSMLALWTCRTLWHLSGPKQVSTKKELEKKNNVLTATKVRFDIWTCQGLSLPRPVWLVCTKQLNFGSTPQALTNISLDSSLTKQIKGFHKIISSMVQKLGVGKCYWTMSREKKPRNPSEPHFCHFCLPLFVQILAAPPLLLSQVDGWRHSEMEKENTF